MIVEETAIAGVLRLATDRYEDTRGHFEEMWHNEKFQALGLDISFVQANHSRSNRHVLRGLHFQQTNPQAKLVMVTRGRVFDVAVDLRISSPTFRHWHGEELSEDKPTMLYISEGCAHGFLTLDGPADLVYFCTAHFDANDDHALAWNDPDIAIEWPLLSDMPILSDRDARAPKLPAFLPMQ